MPHYIEAFPISPRFENGRITSVQDWLGNRFGVGDMVIYCVTRAPRGGKMALGTVKKIEQAPDTDGGRYIGEGIQVQVLTIVTPEGASGNRSPQWVVPSNVTALVGVEGYAKDRLGA